MDIRGKNKLLTGNDTRKWLQQTCFKIVDSFEVADEKVSGDDDGGVAQNIEEQAEEPHVLPAAQQRSVFSKHRRQNTQRRTPTQTEEKISYITLATLHTCTYLYWTRTKREIKNCHTSANLLEMQHRRNNAALLSQKRSCVAWIQHSRNPAGLIPFRQNGFVFRATN